MITYLLIVFWCSIGLLFHSYVGYPLLMRLLSRFKKDDRVRLSDDDPEEEWPTILGVMAAHNEESVIGETIKSIFATNYPKEKLHLFIGSDNSSDSTHDIIQELQKEYPNLHLRIFNDRNGKIRIVNTLVAQDCSELIEGGNTILMPCDSNVLWTEDVPRLLARHFKDERVGQVATNVLDIRWGRKGIGDQEQTYINGENAIKFAEGKLWGRTMGAFGACFAQRSELFKPVPEEFTSDDFFHTVHVFTEDYDVVTDLDAICYENVSEKISEEFRRKKRISMGNFQNLHYYWNYLLPWNAGLPTFFAFWSHKGLRWFGPVLLIAAFFSNAALAFVGGPFFLVTLLGQIIGYAMAMVDYLFEQKGRKGPKLFRYARYFMFMNLAMFLGMMRYLFGERSSVWQPTERVVDPQLTSPRP